MNMFLGSFDDSRGLWRVTLPAIWSTYIRSWFIIDLVRTLVHADHICACVRRFLARRRSLFLSTGDLLKHPCCSPECSISCRYPPSRLI